MFPILYHLVQTIQPVIKPICFVVAWSFITLLSWSLLSATRNAVTRAKQMHKIPCTNCQFFTNDYRLKCTAQPLIANTEKAINCSDYCSKQNSLC